MAGAHKDWLATNLNPNWLKTFKVSRDPRLAEKAIDIVGLYPNPDYA